VLAAELNIDVMLFDLSPASTWWNQLIIAACDYVLPVTLADANSVISLESLLQIYLPRWAKEHANVYQLLHWYDNSDNIKNCV
jgi:hypothetical protein